jgi:hypothetical protein
MKTEKNILMSSRGSRMGVGAVQLEESILMKKKIIKKINKMNMMNNMNRMKMVK